MKLSCSPLQRDNEVEDFCLRFLPWNGAFTSSSVSPLNLAINQSLVAVSTTLMNFRTLTLIRRVNKRVRNFVYVKCGREHAWDRLKVSCGNHSQLIYLLSISIRHGKWKWRFVFGFWVAAKFSEWNLRDNDGMPQHVYVNRKSTLTLKSNHFAISANPKPKACTWISRFKRSATMCCCLVHRGFCEKPLTVINHYWVLNW